MKKIFFPLLLILFSCNPPSDLNPPPELNSGEEKMVGVWYEIADKGLVYDSIGGTVIDSFDVSAIYEFKNDFTFTSQNEFYTKATHGTWEFDTIYADVYIYPIDDLLPTAYRRDKWNVTHNPPFMEVEHTFDYIFLDGTIGAQLYFRKFRKAP